MSTQRKFVDLRKGLGQAVKPFYVRLDKIITADFSIQMIKLEGSDSNYYPSPKAMDIIREYIEDTESKSSL